MAGIIYGSLGRSKRKPSNSQRLKTAKVEHESWLRERGLLPEQRKSFSVFIDRLPNLHVEREYPKLPGENGFAPVLRKQTAMEIRYRESPEVRSEIERKSMRIGQTYNKGGHGYMSDGDVATPRTRK